MTDNLQEAIKSSLYTEKSAMDFYRMGARHLQDPEAKRIFELLAQEEAGHAAHFFRIYRGGDIPDFEAFINDSTASDAGWSAALKTLIDDSFTAKRALELAMEKEQQLEEVLRQIAGSVQDPEARAVFEQNADETRNHYLMIEAEYARVMKMVHESDMNTFVRE